MFWLLRAAVLATVPTIAGAPAAEAQGRTRHATPAAPADGRLVPFYPLQGTFSLNLEVAPAAAPAVGPAGVYMALGNGNVALYGRHDGAYKWAASHRARQGLVLDGDRLLVTTDDSLVALRAADGELAWKVPLPAPAAFAPVARGGWVFVALGTGALTALRADTGAAVWTVPYGPPSAVPAVEGDRIYAATTTGAVHAIAVDDGKPLWQTTLEGAATAVAAIEGHVFVATSGRWLYALDHRGQVRWRFRVQGPAIGLLVDEDRVVAVMLDQSVRAFKIGSGAQAWRQEISFRPAGGPVLIGGSVLVTGFSPSVRILDRRTGANQGTYAVPLPVAPGAITLETLASGPLVQPGPTYFDDIVVLVTQHGWIHAARRAFDPPAAPLTAMPTTPLPAPAPPPGYVEPPAAAPTPTPDPAAPPATPPTTAPSAGTPSRRPPTPPAR